MKAIDISKPVETRARSPVRGLRLRTGGHYETGLGLASDYPLVGDVVTPNAGIVTCSWTADGRHDHVGGDFSSLNIHNVIENPNEIDWNKPGILDELQYRSGRPHNFTRVLATDKEGKYPVLLMHKGGNLLSHFTEEGAAPLYSEDLVRKPVKVTRTLYFAKAHIDAIEKGNSDYLNNSHGDVAVKVEYTI